MSKTTDAYLLSQRDGLLRELDHIEKRRKAICEQIDAINSKVGPFLNPKVRW